jgi:D-xylose transport system substrate-binding protein
MTIYKPINRIAQISAETAIKMAKGEEIKANSSINDGKYSVPYYKIQSVPVIRENLINTVIYDGFHRLDDVFRNVPKSQWPVIK